MKHTFKKNNEVILYEQIITKKLLRKNLGTSLDSPKKKVRFKYEAQLIRKENESNFFL